jgi:integrase
LIPVLSPLCVHEINRQVLARIAGRAGVKNATRRRDLSAVSSVLRSAVQWGWIEHNPCLDFDRRLIPERHEPIRPPSDAEVEAVLATAGSGRKDGRGGVSARTIKHAHRIMVHALKDGMKHDLIAQNAASLEGAPEVDENEVQVVPKEQIGELIEKLRGRAVYTRAIVALFTGMRRSEVLALRWPNVDLNGKLIRVRESLEQTKECGLRVKTPKTKAGRRDVSLPEIVVDALRDHRREQLELRMALGVGKNARKRSGLPGAAQGRLSVAASVLEGMVACGSRHRYAGGDLPCTAAHPCLAADRRRNRHRDHQSAARPRQAGHHVADLRAFVTKADTKASDAINDALKGLGAP